MDNFAIASFNLCSNSDQMHVVFCKRLPGLDLLVLGRCSSPNSKLTSADYELCPCVDMAVPLASLTCKVRVAIWAEEVQEKGPINRLISSLGSVQKESSGLKVLSFQKSPEIGVARFVLAQNTKTGKIYQITTNYTKCS
jgi:hypothetical protein